jgi:Icc-related predicted phosphoesterase
MKIQIVSDIHLEFDPYYDIAPTDADVLVIAGDVCEVGNIELFESFFSDISDKFQHIFYVLGNHEYYNSEYFDTQTKAKEILDPFPNVHVLDNSVFELDDILFIGTTLWTDFNAGSPIAMQEANHNMMDFRIIRHGENQLTVDDIKAVNKNCRTFLLGSVQTDRKVVIITHHLPDMVCVNDKWKQPHTMQLNYAFANTGLLDSILNQNPVLWIFGHTHDKVDMVVQNTRLVCNPKGYRQENRNFQQHLVVEV